MHMNTSGPEHQDAQHNMSAPQRQVSALSADPDPTETAGDRAQTSITLTGTKVDPRTRTSIVHHPSKQENDRILSTILVIARVPTNTRRPGRGRTNVTKPDLVLITKQGPGQCPQKVTACCQKSSSQTKIALTLKVASIICHFFARFKTHRMHMIVQ